VSRRPPPRWHPERKAADNVAAFRPATAQLRCGHDAYGLPDVSAPVGKPDMYFCPQGCGLVAGRRRKAAPE
jgi:hypothetical protein